MIRQALACTLGLMIALMLSSPLSAEDIPTRAFFDKAKVQNMKIAPDGGHIAFTYEDGTQVKLAVMNLEREEIISSFEFGENQHVLSFWWGNNERVVMSVGEVTGNLDNMGRPQHLYAADIDGTRREQIFEMSRSGYQVLHPLPEEERYILISRYHAGDEGQPKGNRLDIYDGELDYVGSQPLDNHMTALVADNDGVLRGGAALEMGETLADRELRLYVRDEGEWRSLEIPAERSSPAVDFLGFSKDNRQVYFTSNHDMPEGDRLGVFRYDFDDDEIELLHREDDRDVLGLLRSHEGEVLGVYSRFGPMTYTFFEDKVEANMEAIRLLQRVVVSFPGQDVTLASRTVDGDHAIVHVRGDTNPGEFYLLDTDSMEMRFLVGALPDLPQDELVDMEPVTITARDDLELHALMTYPEGGREDLPLIVNVHGGPFGITDRWGFNPEAQFFAHHGYATLQVNFRGSGNRGEDFQRAGWKEWGGKMQNDVTDATRWAIEQGIADPERICIYGGSYGGYASLTAVFTEPDLYQCAIGYVGVYDLPWFREGDGSDFSSGQGREARTGFERFMSTAVGDDEEKLRRASPVHNVDKIRAELFIIHGGSDVRVPIGHAERLREALDEIGKDYRWLVKEDEGHGFYDVDNRVETYDAMLDFVDSNIGPDAESAD